MLDFEEVETSETCFFATGVERLSAAAARVVLRPEFRADVVRYTGAAAEKAPEKRAINVAALLNPRKSLLRKPG